MTGEDTKLAAHKDYNDLSTYMGKYVIFVDDKQCYLTDKEQILNLSEEEKAMTLQEVRQEAIEEEKEDLAWEKKLESQPPVMTRASSYNSTNAVSYARKWAEKEMTLMKVTPLIAQILSHRHYMRVVFP